jgi:hypothetical protein
MKQYQRIQRLAIIVLFFVIGMLIWINQDGTIVDEVYFFQRRILIWIESRMVEELNQLKDHYGYVYAISGDPGMEKYGRPVKTGRKRPDAS